ncbi:hypothetical protein, partial [Pseudomonas sp. GM80]|uniref:hypothetical protein n=1 Tax=Pseudomonas sp. GM80 TaxID=1144339 RepID=UPI001EE68F70
AAPTGGVFYLETENENPPLGRVGCCSRELARQMRNGGNNAWLATQYGGIHVLEISASVAGKSMANFAIRL